MAYTPAEFKRELYKCEGAVYNLDKTLVDGRVAEGVGKQFLISELFQGHLGHIWLGAKNYGEVNRLAKEQGHTAGLKHFIGVIASTGCATYDMFFRYARKYISEKQLPGSSDFISYVGDSGGLYKQLITTLGADLSARAARHCFDGWIKDSIGNPLTYDGIPGENPDELITGINILMSNGEERLELTEKMLKKYGLSAGQCFVVGNDASDHELMRAARMSAASPLADNETKELAHIWIPDYRTFLEELNGP